jgi:mannosyltransferase
MKVDAEAPPRALPDEGERPGREQRFWRSLIALSVGAVIAVGLVLRFVTTSDLWLDEALTVNIARLPLDELPEALRHDGAPPLYYVLLHGWMKVFGTGDTAVRALSGVFGVLALPAAWFAGRRLGGRVVAWAAVLVLVTSPFAIRYATEARPYELQMLLVLLGYLAVCRALERPALGRLAAVAGVTGLLLYTAYWSIYLLAVVGAGLVIRAWRGASGRSFLPRGHHRGRRDIPSLAADVPLPDGAHGHAVGRAVVAAGRGAARLPGLHRR